MADKFVKSWRAQVILLLFHVHCSFQEEPTATTYPERGHEYPVQIGAEHHMVQGRISSEAAVGTLVSSNVIMEGEEDADMTVHLRVEIRESKYKRPHVYHPDIVINVTDPNNPQFEHPVIKFPNNTLPDGMEFVVVHTNAFYITKNRYIAVNDFASLGGDTRIHFDVLLKDKLSETPYVSNSLPFVVEIDYPRVETNPNAALFAGVLVLAILLISLLIPFSVRAKRRMKAGKPICGCGSAEDNSECGSVGSQPDFMKHRAMSLGGKDNLAMMLDHDRLMKPRPSEGHLHRTIQNRMVRSESSLHLQPQWLDPHLSDYYHRPDFSRLQELYDQQQQQEHFLKHGNNHGDDKDGGAKGHSTSNGTAGKAGLAPPGSKLPPGFLTPPLPHAPPPGMPAYNGAGATSNGYLAAPGGSMGYPFYPPPWYPQQTNMFGNNVFYNDAQTNGNGGNSISRASSFNNGLAFFRAPRGTQSNRSSSNSLYTYPANFNQGLDVPTSMVSGTNSRNGVNGGKMKGGEASPAAAVGTRHEMDKDQPLATNCSSSAASKADANINGNPSLTVTVAQDDDMKTPSPPAPDSGHCSDGGISNQGLQMTDELVFKPTGDSDPKLRVKFEDSSEQPVELNTKKPRDNFAESGVAEERL